QELRQGQRRGALDALAPRQDLATPTSSLRGTNQQPASQVACWPLLPVTGRRQAFGRALRRRLTTGLPTPVWSTTSVPLARGGPRKESTTRAKASAWGVPGPQRSRCRTAYRAGCLSLAATATPSPGRPARRTAAAAVVGARRAGRHRGDRPRDARRGA